VTWHKTRQRADRGTVHETRAENLQLDNGCKEEDKIRRTGERKQWRAKTDLDGLSGKLKRRLDGHLSVERTRKKRAYYTGAT